MLFFGIMLSFILDVLLELFWVWVCVDFFLCLLIFDIGFVIRVWFWNERCFGGFFEVFFDFDVCFLGVVWIEMVFLFCFS